MNLLGQLSLGMISSLDITFRKSNCRSQKFGKFFLQTHFFARIYIIHDRRIQNFQMLPPHRILKSSSCVKEVEILKI